MCLRMMNSRFEQGARPQRSKPLSRVARFL